MAVSDLLNTAVKPADVQASLAYSSMDMRDEFQKWLTDGNARKYSPKVVLSCMDKISDYACRKKIAAGSLWEYAHPNAFSPVYKRLIEAKLLRITDRKTHKVFITAGQLYLRFLKEKPFRKETAEDNSAVTVPSTELAIKRLFAKKADWSLFNYGFAVPQSSVSAFFEAICTLPRYLSDGTPRHTPDTNDTKPHHEPIYAVSAPHRRGIL